jgi:hypothetical protein
MTWGLARSRQRGTSRQTSAAVSDPPLFLAGIYLYHKHGRRLRRGGGGKEEQGSIGLRRWRSEDSQQDDNESVFFFFVCILLSLHSGLRKAGRHLIPGEEII